LAFWLDGAVPAKGGETPAAAAKRRRSAGSADAALLLLLLYVEWLYVELGDTNRIG